MNTQRSRSNVLLRHPIIFSITVLVIAAFLFAPKPAENKKLDYSKPIYTANSAIICPQNLLFDPRADHDSNAIIGVFTSILHRDEKAKALGCEVLREGIPVKVHRMGAPFKDYVAVNLFGQQDGSLFTMEANLENNDSADTSAAGPANTPGTQTTANDPKTSEQIPVDVFEEGRTAFQKQLASLEKPAANLRWLAEKDFISTQNKSPTAVSAFLFTPYGSCAFLVGDKPYGYSVMSSHDNPFMTHDAKRSLGTFSDEAPAAAAAVQYCRDWYTAESSKPHNDLVTNHLYFSPDPEEKSVPSTGQVSSAPEDQNQASATETTDVTTLPQVKTDQSPSIKGPPLLSRAPEASFRWQMGNDGDEVLIGPTGPCATLAVQSAHDPNKVHLNFSDGTTKIYTVEETPVAMQAAQDYCRASP